MKNKKNKQKNCSSEKYKPACPRPSFNKRMKEETAKRKRALNKKK